jgi:hypothetical protein
MLPRRPSGFSFFAFVSSHQRKQLLDEGWMEAPISTVCLSKCHFIEELLCVGSLYQHAS